MKASDLFVKCLESEGVKYVFGLPGEEIEDLLFSLAHSSIKFIPTRHEQGAAFMADVYGRLTGKAGVCLATLGPGATNLITGMADAHLDKSPIVAITGQGELERLHKESHQLVDIIDIFRSITKWNTTVYTPEVIPEVIRKAFKLAQMEKPGATHIELPEDVARLDIGGKNALAPRIVRRPSPDYKALNAALEVIKEAKNPIILVGNGAIRKLASKHLRLFVAHTNIPVVATFMGKGAISDEDAHSLFTIGLKGRDFSLCALEAADVVITIGYDIAEYAPELWNPQKLKKIIHIDFIPAEVYEYYQPEVEIIADISATLWELNKYLEKTPPHFSDWYLPIRKAILEDFEKYELKEDGPFTVPGVLRVVRSILDEETIVISDVGAHKMWVGRNFPVYTAGSCIISNGFASMGISVPGGIAAKLAHPNRVVVAITGDGGFLMNSQEIETAKRIGVSFTILILNDNNYGLITWKQQLHKRESFGTALTNPDFVTYAKSFGIPAFAPKTKFELRSALQQAIASNVISLIAVEVDPKENLRLSKKLDADICKNFSLS